MITTDFETSQGRVALRGLKRREIKTLRAEGVNVGGVVSLESLEGHTEAVLKMVLPEQILANFEELEESEILRMHREVIRLTYPTEEQVKNSE